MTKRYTVSVSDELAEGIERWKSEVSPSAIFQSAMTDAINRKEALAQRIKEEPTMESIINRLKAEREDAENDYKEQGKERGLEWAKCASYKELKYAAEVFCNYDDFPLEIRDLAHNEILGIEFNECIFATDDLGLLPAHNDEEINENAQYWLEGWMEAVSAFWDEVRTKL